MSEKKVIELDVQTNLGSLKSQLKQAQQEVQTLADKFGATSEQAVNAAKKAAVLKDKIGDAKSLTDAFNPDAKFKALSGTLTGVAGGFSVVTGALGAFGKQNEDVEQALLKVQSAMALASGAQAIGESIDSFKQLGAVIKASTAFQYLMTAAQYAYNLAMSLNPVGAIVTAVVALIAAGYALITMFMAASAANEQAAATTEKHSKALDKQIASNDKVSSALKTRHSHEINMAKASGKSAEAIRKLAMKHADEEIALEKASIATAKNTLEKERNTLAAQRAAGVDEDIIQKQVELVKKSSENLKKEYKDLEDAYKSKADLARSNQVEIQQEKTDAINEAKQKQEEADKAARDKAQENYDKKKEAKKEYDNIIAKANLDSSLNALQTENELQKSLEDVAEQNYLATLSEQDREKLAVQDKYFELQTLAENAGKSTTEIEIAKLNELNDINLKYQDLDYSQKEEAIKKQADLDSKAAEKKIEAEQAVADFKEKIRQADFANAEAGINLIGKVFEKNKKIQAGVLIAQNALSIAKTIIENKAANAAITLQGSSLAIASGGVSVGVAAGLVLRNNISAALSIGGIVAATAKGLSALKAGGSPTGGNTGGDTGGGGGGGGGAAPKFNVVGNSGINQLGQLQQRPIKAYVVSGDMSTAQSLDRNRIQNATLVQ